MKKAKATLLEDAEFKPNSFDTILMMEGNFGLLGNLIKARRLVKRFHKMTSKNALIIAETRDPYKTNNPAPLEYHKLNKKRGKMSGQTRIRVRFEKIVTKWFDWLMVSKGEIQELLKGTGWQVKKFIGSEDARYIAIIEKVS